ncbi:hypothetical protein ACFL1M_00415 [Patescibacteria group bacterium]
MISADKHKVDSKKINKKVLKKHFSLDDLSSFLLSKQHLSGSETEKHKDHINNCRDCWNLWNKTRWDASKGSLGLQELEIYLGSSFVEYFDSSLAIANDWLNKNPSSKEEVADFYKNTNEYLYNLIIWYESGDRDTFSSDMDKISKRFSVSSFVDYGCGVGNDGLLMIEKGFRAEFVDYMCPSVDFLKWRLNNRALKNVIIDVEKARKLPDVEVFWAIDVLEHMVNPLEVVEKLSKKTKVFVHRSEFGNTHGGRHPFHFDFDEMRLNNALKKAGFKHIPWSKLTVWVKN